MAGEPIEIGVVPAGTRVNALDGLLTFHHPDHPVRFFDKFNPRAGIQTLEFPATPLADKFKG